MMYRKSRKYFRRGLCLTYFCAFTSSFVQYPGLFSSLGITPVLESRGNRPNPFATDEFMFAVHVVAMAVSLGIGFDFLLSSSLMFLLPLCYWYIIHLGRETGSPFFNYQWDSLLVETGVIGSLWTLKTSEDEAPPMSAVWGLRFLAFKLMFSSGVVKITANDRTWLDLNALRYHFASQPLPTPLAWYASKLPDWCLRLGTAGSMWIEIPVALLILAPFPQLRLLAALSNSMLMMNIALTGNYNFFNLLTMVLMIPLVNEDDFKRKSFSASNIAGSVLGMGALMWYTSTCLFDLVPDVNNKSFPVRLKLSAHQLTDQMNNHLHLTVAWSFACIVVGIIHDVSYSWRYDNARILHVRVAVGVLAFGFVAMSAVPMMFSLCTDHSLLNKVLPGIVRNTYVQYGSEFTSSYGLFRVMTGVGKDGRVRVPTVLLQISDDGSSYRPLQFRAYSGSVVEVPSFVQPHQPRLDWQMWFLSLAPQRAKHEQWFKSFCAKLFAGERAVWNLISSSEAIHRGYVKKIRLEVAEFDFTEFGEQSKWWREVSSSNARHVILEMSRPASMSSVADQRESPLLAFWIDFGAAVPFTLLALVASLRRM